MTMIFMRPSVRGGRRSRADRGERAGPRARVAGPARGWQAFADATLKVGMWWAAWRRRLAGLRDAAIRWARMPPPPGSPRRRFVVIQIDGLSHAAFERAL